MNNCHCVTSEDKRPEAYLFSVEKTAVDNVCFRKAVWTGCYLQMTVMCIPPCRDIGKEIHTDTEQFIRIEQGTAVVKMGRCQKQLDYQKKLCRGDGIFVPAGIWHNVINIGSGPLKVSSIYAPPHHPAETVQRTKEEAEWK